MKFCKRIVQYLLNPAQERIYFGLLCAMTAVTASYMLHLAFRLHWNFMIIASDTAAFQNAIVNTLHGDWFRNTAYDGPNMLGVHATLVLLLVAPIYAAFPHPETLFVLQIIGIYSAVIPIYFLGLRNLKKASTAFFIAVAFLLNPMSLHMAMGPFHPETWIATAALWSLVFYIGNQVWGFWLSVAFALSCGEQAALLYISLGIALFAFDDAVSWRKRYALWSICSGSGWLFFTEAVLLPLMHSHGQENILTRHYSNWPAQSFSGLLIAVIRDPKQGIELLLNPNRWIHLAGMLGLPLLLALLFRRSILLIAVFPVYFLMDDQEFFLLFHAYYFQFALLAGYLGLIMFLKRFDIATNLGLAAMVGTTFINVLTSYSALSVYAGLDAGSYDELNYALIAEFQKIPKDAAVYGPHRFADYLSNHPNMVMGDLADENLDFKAMLDARYNETDVHPEQIEYIVCDTLNDQIGWRQANYSQDTAKQRITNVNKLIQSGQWQMDFNLKDVVILQRRSPTSTDQ